MPENEAPPHPKGDGSTKSQPPYVAVVIAFLGVVSSLGTAYLTAHSTLRDTENTVRKDAQNFAKAEITNFKSDVIAGVAIVGEIRAFAFGGEYADDEISDLRASGWLECAGQAIDRDDYPRLYELLQRKRTPWGASNGRPRVPDLRGMFLRGWFHGSVPEDVKDEVSARRSPDPSGAKGDNVGSFQGDELKSHAHPMRSIEGPELGKFPRDATVWHTNQEGRTWKMKLQTEGGSTGYPAEGKKETAPKNVLVMYCIYAGTGPRRAG